MQDKGWVIQPSCSKNICWQVIAGGEQKGCIQNEDDKKRNKWTILNYVLELKIKQ